MKRFGMRASALIAALVLTAGLSACGTENGGVAATEGQGTFPVGVVDSFGDEILIESEPETIISCSPGITEIICALGAGDRLAARTDYCDYPPEVLETESIGSVMTPDMERIVELVPDIVFASTHFPDDSMTLLRAAEITILALFAEETFEGSYDLIEDVGRALGLDAEAARIVADMKGSVAETMTDVEGLERPTVYYVVGYGEYGDYTSGGDTFIGQMLEMAGGENIAAEVSGWSYSLESLLEADPDVIIVSGMYDTKAGFISAEGYKELTAVKEGRVYEIDNNMLDRQGVRNAEGLRVLAEILHPEAFE